MRPIHELKIWPEFYRGILNGEKTFEVRKNDRDFRVGDILHLKEWDNDVKSYTDNTMLMAEITSILYGPAFGIQEGFCVMSLGNVQKNWEPM